MRGVTEANGWPAVPAVFLCLLLCASAPARAGGSDWVGVALRPLVETVQAFAQVVPQRTLRLAAPLAGHLAQLQVRPGDRVQRGETLGRLTGPAIDARLEAARQSVVGDKAGVSAAAQELKSIRQKAGERLATRNALIRARLALTRSRAQLRSDQAQLKSLQRQIRLTAPAAGQVTRLSATNGDFLGVGQPVMQIRPDQALWLSARFYGARGRRLKPGQQGQFHPDGGGRSLAVTLATLMPDPDASGTWQVYFMPQHTPADWFAGQAGTLTLQGAGRRLPAVPSGALIMDQGTWWVMVEKSDGPKPVKVTPVASQGGWTWVRHGLSAGQQVLVKGAYQAYHRDFASQYANPD